MNSDFISAMNGTGKRRKAAEEPQEIEVPPVSIPQQKNDEELMREDLDALRTQIRKILSFKNDPEILGVLRMRLHTELRKWDAKELVKLALEITALVQEIEIQT